MRLLSSLLAWGLLLALCCSGFALTRIENFTTDPGWQGMGNRRQVGCFQVVQDFGFSYTWNAGVGPGEIGGRISRTTTPAHYGKPISARSLEGELAASGRICLVDNGDGGCFVGWFNSLRQGWRPVNFLGFRLDGANVHLAYTTGNWMAEGLGTGLSLNPGVKHNWSISYDPGGPGGLGTISFLLDGELRTLDLLPGHRTAGASFDRFGLFNLQEPGGYQVVYLDDLDVDGRFEAFDEDPGWDGSGNREEFRDCVARGTQDFGYAESSIAGGEAGEMGGLIWRSEARAYCADQVGSLDLEDAIRASGSLSVTQASSDSGFLLGYFGGGGTQWPVRPFLGFMVEGPSRVGHYFRLRYDLENGTSGESEGNPIVYPNGTLYHWNLAYDPSSRMLRGDLDGIQISVILKEGNATFSKFGLHNIPVGGHQITAYLDDLQYTCGVSEGTLMFLPALGLVRCIRRPGRRSVTYLSRNPPARPWRDCSP